MAEAGPVVVAAVEEAEVLADSGEEVSVVVERVEAGKDSFRC